MNLISKLWAVAALVSPLVAAATPVTLGSLTRDGDLIVDTLNNRTWLGWDVTQHLTYAQAVAATSSEGAFEGYSIARNVDAQLFMTALLGTHSCTSANNIVCNTVATGAAQAIVGENFFTGSDHWDADYAWFLSDNGVDQDAGLMGVESFGSGDELLKFNEWGSFPSSDRYATQGIGWALYRNGIAAAAVPEPGSVGLVAAALLGLAWSRRRKA